MKELKELQEIVAAAPTMPILDMLAKSVNVIERHEKIMVSLSGGSDSDILAHIFHLLDRKGKAHYVFFNTGLEYQATKRHLADLEETYGITIEWIDPVLPIPTCCRKYGVPFWSKQASEYIYRLQKHNFQWENEPFEVLYKKYPKCKAALRWWCNDRPKKKNGGESSFNIAYTPWLKEFMIANPPDFPIARKCCEKAKKEPAQKYIAAHDYDLDCTGVRKAEGGPRAAIKTCFSASEDGADVFRPLFWLTDQDKRDYKEHYGVVNSDCYEVWGMKRTGCCGCPYGKEFEKELELMQQYEPKLYKAAVNIFGKSYDYTRRYLAFRERMKEANKDERADESAGDTP